MDPKHITSQSLRHLLALTEKKEQFLKGIEEVENEIAKTLAGAKATVVKAAVAITASKPARKKAGKKAKAGKPGGLKERILAVLHDAGDRGLRVKEIAEKLAAKPGNIAVWFSTTGKKLARKIEPGRYALKGAKAAAPSTQTVTGYLKPPASMRVKKAAGKPGAKPAPVASAAKKPSKAKKKGGISPEGRARLAANMKARWAARKAGKPAAKAAKPAKKGFKLPKAGKNPF